MPASDLNIGVTEASDAAVQSVEIEESVSEVVRQDRESKFLVGQTFNPVRSGSIKILGESDDEVGGDLSTALASISEGVTIVNEKMVNTTQDNFDETDVSFQNFPNAT